MRRAVLLVGLALLASLLLPMGALAGAGGTNLPLKEAGSGYATISLTGALHSESTSIGAHVGLSTEVQDGQLSPTATPGLFTFVSTATGTAANGDESTWACSGTLEVTAETTTGEADCVMTVGTGRFEGASGTMHTVIHGIASGYFEFTNVGEMSWNHKK